MAQKRKNGNEADNITGREKKKLKMSAARTIATQAGPSQSTSHSKPMPTNSMTGMPSAIDIEKFVDARAFEIDAMHTAMKTASSTSTHRVWQTLPRHLRRRAASHDVRRVPLRLREKARAEMDPVRKKALGRAMPKRGKHKYLSRTKSLLKRQRDKMWLETHIWHAKRMHMKKLWGYTLAMTPTEKVYRPSHRASIHGSILHDASYYSLAEIKGSETVLVTMLETLCDPQGPGPGSKRCLGGSRALETHIYKPDSYPFDLIGPVTIIWQPKSTSSDVNSSKSRKLNEKKPQDVSPAVGQTGLITARTIWLRFHPSIQFQVFETLKQAASRTLVKYKTNANVPQEATLQIADLKRHVNVFEIMGPKSSQVIKGALSPVASEKREEFLKFWASLTNLQSAGSIPRGMIIGFKVNDPRLKFPPKNAKPKIDNSSNVSINMTLPSGLLASSDIWDDAIRNGLAKPRFKKKDLDDRRSKNDIPGTPLNALRQDDRIPVLLIQRSLETSSNPDSQALHGWTLVVPAGWSMAFFHSLIFTNTRVGGQRERQTQAYEAGTMYYPRDYPFTRAYDAYALDRESADKSAWERKPPAKRVNFEALGMRSPWRADWDAVLGISTQDEERVNSDPPAFATTQRETVMNVVKPKIKPWLLRGSEVPKILSSIFSVFNHGITVLSEINRLRVKRGQAPLSNDFNPTDLLKGALTNVKVSMCSRGAPQDLAAIYLLSDDAYRNWEKALLLRESGGVSLEDDTPQEAELSEIVPNPNSIIGYVTTGHYSLARGEGFAIGAISVVHLIELEQQSLRLRLNQKARTKMLASLRNPDSHHCRAVNIEVISDA